MYSRTFRSTQTTKGWVISLFSEGKTDAAKSIVFIAKKSLWAGIKDDVKAWCLENWERWEEEKPEWFNEMFQGAVDDDMIPDASLIQMRLKARGERRRSSIFKKVGEREGSDN